MFKYDYLGYHFFFPSTKTISTISEQFISYPLAVRSIKTTSQMELLPLHPKRESHNPRTFLQHRGNKPNRNVDRNPKFQLLSRSPYPLRGLPPPPAHLRGGQQPRRRQPLHHIPQEVRRQST